MPLTKQDLDSIGQVVDSKVGILDNKMDDLRKEMQADFVVMRNDIHEIRDELSCLREQIQTLAVTLDNFLKRMTDREDEFVILKGEVDEIKRIIKDKLGVEVRVAF